MRCDESMHGRQCEQPAGHSEAHSHSGGTFCWSTIGGAALKLPQQNPREELRAACAERWWPSESVVRNIDPDACDNCGKKHPGSERGCREQDRMAGDGRMRGG